jgi:putative DNA methylase
MAVAGLADGQRGRVYLPADAVPMPPTSTIKERLRNFGDSWPGPASVRLPEDARNFWAYLYGADTYDKLFTDRQAIALLSFSQAIRNTYLEIAKATHDGDLAKAVLTYLAFALDKFADHSTSLARWHNGDQKMVGTLSRQAIPMVWDFAEVNPFLPLGGSFAFTLASEVDAIRGLIGIPSETILIRGSSTDLPYETNSIDAIITDPPYYDNISYADISDFFYVWLKRTLEQHYPEHLSGSQTPKKQ